MHGLLEHELGFVFFLVFRMLIGMRRSPEEQLATWGHCMALERMIRHGVKMNMKIRMKIRLYQLPGLLRATPRYGLYRSPWWSAYPWKPDMSFPEEEEPCTTQGACGCSTFWTRYVTPEILCFRKYRYIVTMDIKDHRSAYCLGHLYACFNIQCMNH